MRASEAPWLTYSRYLRQRHGCMVYRVAVDAGFSCPNRAGGRSGSGCSYCAADGSRAPYLGADTGAADGSPHTMPGPASRCSPDLGRQVRDGMAFLRRRYGADAFILFFQAYSNTNAPVEVLRRVYDAGLSFGPFKGLNVATRPDCVDEARADLLASYRGGDREVWCELGLQSAHDATLRRIGRGHTWEDFRRAFHLLKERGVRTAVHLIFGLPGENREDILQTIDAVAGLGIDGVKIHNLHIPSETVIAREFTAGEITAPCAERHLDYVIAALERLPPRTVIMRLQCDTPARQLAAPRHFWDKTRFTEEVAARMRARGTSQGRLATRGADGADTNA